MKDRQIARRIADTLTLDGYTRVLEVGPGMGVLTRYLLEKQTEVKVVELDGESVGYLGVHFPELEGRIIEADFLKMDLAEVFDGKPFALIGNYPYNISTQIMFKALENRHLVPEICGMFQREVAQRICSSCGSKVYGILSVLLQVYYEAEYLFTVDEGVFNPPPKVKSGVIRLRRRKEEPLGLDQKMLFKVVKTAFGQRRKTLRNALKSLNPPQEVTGLPFMDRRPEELSVDDFILLTRLFGGQ